MKIYNLKPVISSFYIPLDGPVKVVRDVKFVTPESLSKVLRFLSALERRLRTFLTGRAL